MASSSTLVLQGIIPPVVTPLTDQGSLDEEGLTKLLRHVLAGGVHGLFVLGTTGEAPSLSEATKRALVEQVGNEVGRRIPWLVGITDTCLADAIAWAERVATLGATAVVAAPPYYFPLDQAALYRYFRQLSEAIPLPLVLYNIPSHASHYLVPETILALLQLPNIVGYKDSTGNMLDFHQLRLQWSNTGKSHLVGPEELLLETMLLGAQGGVNGGANIFPELYVRLYEAARQGHIDEAKRLHNQVVRLSHHLYQGGKTVISGIKLALAEKGICQPWVAPPLPTLSEEEKQSMRQFLRKFEPVLL